MSKTALRKELEQMSAEQLRQIILEAYDARKETRDYFEFFINPDVKRFMEKQKSLIAKELSRVKWGRSRARVTVIKKAVRDFTSLNPGPEAVLDMIFAAIEEIGLADRFVTLTPSLERLTAALAADYTGAADRFLMADTANSRLATFLGDDTFRQVFRTFVAQNARRI